MQETIEVQELSLEKVIETKLIQNNVTEKVLSELKDRYGSLKLKALDDKESYLELKTAAKDCAKIRNLTTKVCKMGREDAVKVQKMWVAEEKRVISRIAEVEDPLDAEIAKFDAEVDRKVNEEKEMQEAAYINRQAILTRMGATYSDGEFVLGNASFEANLIKSSSEDIWEESIVPKFKEEYEKIEVVRIAAQKKKDDEALELKRQQDELAKQQEEFRIMQDKMQKEKEDVEKKMKEVNDKKFTERLSLLSGWSFNGITVSRNGNIFGSKYDLYSATEDQFKTLVQENIKYLEQKEKEDSVKRDAEIQLAKKQAVQQEKQRLADIEAKRQADLEASKDKDKWDAFLLSVKALEIFDMRSGQYRRRMQIAKEKIEEILSL